MKQMLGLWRDTWWLWTVFLAMTVVFALFVGSFLSVALTLPASNLHLLCLQPL